MARSCQGGSAMDRHMLASFLNICFEYTQLILRIVCVCVVMKLHVSSQYDIALNVCTWNWSSNSMEKLHNLERIIVCSYVWDVMAYATRGTEGTQRLATLVVEIITVSMAWMESHVRVLEFTCLSRNRLSAVRTDGITFRSDVGEFYRRFRCGGVEGRSQQICFLRGDSIVRFHMS